MPLRPSPSRQVFMGFKLPPSGSCLWHWVDPALDDLKIILIVFMMVCEIGYATIWDDVKYMASHFWLVHGMIQGMNLGQRPRAATSY